MARPSLAPWLSLGHHDHACRPGTTHWNILENFPHFAVFVLIANAVGLANDQTALGATIFFWARLAHAVVYISGIWRLRWVAFFAAVGGEILIVGRLLLH